jgi:hypothetical protein
VLHRRLTLNPDVFTSARFRFETRTRGFIASDLRSTPGDIGNRKLSASECPRIEKRVEEEYERMARGRYRRYQFRSVHNDDRCSINTFLSAAATDSIQDTVASAVPVVQRNQYRGSGPRSVADWFRSLLYAVEINVGPVRVVSLRRHDGTLASLCWDTVSMLIIAEKLSDLHISTRGFEKFSFSYGRLLE